MRSNPALGQHFGREQFFQSGAVAPDRQIAICKEWEIPVAPEQRLELFHRLGTPVQPDFLQPQRTDAAVVVGVRVPGSILFIIGEENPQTISVIHGDDGVETEFFPVLHRGQSLVDPSILLRVTAAELFPEPGDFRYCLMRHDDAG